MLYINIFTLVKRLFHQLKSSLFTLLACQSMTPIDAHIQFEVWSRFYHPNIRDQLLAKVILTHY